MTRFLVLFGQTDSDAVLEDPLTSGDWLRASLILVAALIIAVVVSRVLRRVIAHAIGPGFASIMLARLAAYIVFVIGLAYALITLGVRVGPLLAAIGVGGLVLALALQGVVENFVNSMTLQARRPFTIGDTVEVDGRVGIVADVDARTTLLHSLDGTHVRVPNTNVVSAPIVNLTRQPLRRTSIDVGVAYDTDLQHATEVLRAALARVPRVAKEPPAFVNLMNFGVSSIDFTIFFWHRSDIPSELAARHDVLVAVHQALSAEGITIAFPQVVVWGGSTDGGGPYADSPQQIRTPRPDLDGTTRENRRLITRPRRAFRLWGKKDDEDA